jgi:DNA-directed RNA polymerase specialized sigma24 family protein
LDKLQKINQYVIDNEKRLKQLCSRLYNGNDLHKDLFQEFYLKVIECTDKQYDNYPLKNLCYGKILECYHNRHRKQYGAIEQKGFFTELEWVKAGHQQITDFDLAERIDAELNKTNDFLDTYIFLESIEKSCREIAAETGLNFLKVHRLAKKGQLKLKKYV